MKKPQIIQNASLKQYNSFGIDVRCSELVLIKTSKDVAAFLDQHEGEIFILGGGSNMLLVGDVEIPVLKNEIFGIEVVAENDKHIMVEVGGGVVWHDFVLWAVEKGYGGIENLSLIPGTVGAAPIQNIGAYGVEQCDSFESLEAIELATGDIYNFDTEQCQFGYRDSYFKNEGKGKYLITSVIYILNKQHQVNTTYGDIQTVLTEREISNPSIQDVSDAVIHIRSSKLPDPSEIGNSGSFFKNPVIDADTFSNMLQRHETVHHYKMGGGQIKIPAGWLIDQSGWKGKREGAVGCYEKQALVIVNHGGATGKEIWSFAQKIQKDVFEKWGIMLEPEVNIIGA